VNRVAVTGANGFVGRRVVAALAAAGTPVRAVVRPGASAVPASAGVDVHRLGTRGWDAALDGCDGVVHLVARTHQLHEATGTDVEAAYRAVNVDLTVDLLAAAQRAGVRRLVLMSSVKAVGESRDAPYDERSVPQPQDAYGRTKLAAEQLVHAAPLDTVVLRPPLVHGPGVLGNVRRLLAALSRGVPLPLGRATARRSLVHVDNLADAVRVSLDHPAATGRTYFVADAEVLSVRELVEELAAGLGRPARLVPVPPGALLAAGRLARRGEEVERLVRPLVLDTAPLRAELAWSPPLRAHEGLRRTAAAYAGTARA
jgi:UDP-glucose 4-epimerase